MGYNAKNYTKQGGEETVIGGKLTINGTLEYGEGAVVPSAGVQEIIPYMANVSGEEGDPVSVEDFNDLLIRLRQSGLMEDRSDDAAGDPWELTASMAEAPPQGSIAANNALASARYDEEGDTITVRVPITQLATATYDGTSGKWLCLAVDTGLEDITEVSLDRTPFTSEDVTAATACGCSAGTFVLYLDAAGVTDFTKVRTIRLDAEGYATYRVDIYVSDTSEEEESPGGGE